MKHLTLLLVATSLASSLSAAPPKHPWERDREKAAQAQAKEAEKDRRKAEAEKKAEAKDVKKAEPKDAKKAEPKDAKKAPEPAKPAEPKAPSYAATYQAELAKRLEAAQKAAGSRELTYKEKAEIRRTLLAEMKEKNKKK